MLKSVWGIRSLHKAIKDLTRIYEIMQNNVFERLKHTLIEKTYIISQNLCGVYTSNILINDTSDHLPTVCVLSSLITTKKEPIVIKSRDTRLHNLEALRRHIREYDWVPMLTDPSPNRNMELVHEKLTSIINHCTPYRERKVNHKKVRKEPWLTASIKISIDRNKKLYSKMLKGKCTKNMYKDYNNQLRKTIRCVKVLFYQNKCQEYKTQTKKLWKIINEIAGKQSNKSSLIEYLKIDNVTEYNAKKISNRFAKYFAVVGKCFAERIPNPSKSILDYLKLLQSNSESLFLTPTHENELKQLVSALPAKTSSGHNNMSNILVKGNYRPTRQSIS